MTTLHGAVTIVKVNNIAVIICKHLYFDMLWSADVFLDEDLVITESLFGFVAGLAVFLRHIFSAVDNTHTAAAAAVGGFQHNRITDHFSNFHDFFFCLQCVIYTRDDRNTGFDSHLFGRNLITHGIHDVFGRSDKYDAGFCAGLNKVRILREKTIARMDSINICLLGNFNNALDIQISINRTFIFFQLIGFVCFGTEEGIAVFLGINTDGCNTQLIQSTINTDGDFASVSDENTFEWFDLYFSHF